MIDKQACEFLDARVGHSANYDDDLVTGKRKVDIRTPAPCGVQRWKRQPPSPGTKRALGEMP